MTPMQTLSGIFKGKTVLRAYRPGDVVRLALKPPRHMNYNGEPTPTDVGRLMRFTVRMHIPRNPSEKNQTNGILESWEVWFKSLKIPYVVVRNGQTVALYKERRA